MAIEAKFGFTNTTDSTNKITPVDIKVMDNYALITDEPDQCTLSNTTCPIDQGELLSYKQQSVKNVSTPLDVLYPAPVTSGVRYVVKLDELLSNQSSNDPSFRVDLPVGAYLTVYHVKHGSITNEIIGEVVRRLCGAVLDEEGNWRFDDLMRSSLKPTHN